MKQRLERLVSGFLVCCYTHSLDVFIPWNIAFDFGLYMLHPSTKTDTLDMTYSVERICDLAAMAIWDNLTPKYGGCRPYLPSSQCLTTRKQDRGERSCKLRKVPARVSLLTLFFSVEKGKRTLGSEQRRGKSV